MLSIFLTTESAMIAKRFFKMTSSRPSPGIVLTLPQNRLDIDSSLKVEQLEFWLDINDKFCSVFGKTVKPYKGLRENIPYLFTSSEPPINDNK